MQYLAAVLHEQTLYSSLECFTLLPTPAALGFEPLFLTITTFLVSSIMQRSSHPLCKEAVIRTTQKAPLIIPSCSGWDPSCTETGFAVTAEAISQMVIAALVRRGLFTKRQHRAKALRSAFVLCCLFLKSPVRIRTSTNIWSCSLPAVSETFQGAKQRGKGCLPFVFALCFCPLCNNKGQTQRKAFNMESHQAASLPAGDLRSCSLPTVSGMLQRANTKNELYRKQPASCVHCLQVIQGAATSKFLEARRRDQQRALAILRSDETLGWARLLVHKR